MSRRVALAWVVSGVLVPALGVSARGLPSACGHCGRSACGSGPVAGGGGAPWYRQGTLYGPGRCSLLPTRESLRLLGLERAWYNFIPLGPGESLLLTSNAEDLLFAQTSRGNLYVLDAESGQILWFTNLGIPSGQAQPVSVNSKSVFATNGNVLYQLDRGSGGVVFRTTLESFATSPTAANERIVAVGMANGKIVAYNVTDRSQEVPPGPRLGSFAWNWSTADRITSRPLLAETLTAFASQDGKLYVAQNAPPEILFRYPTGGPIQASITGFGNRTVIVPTMDNNVHAVDLFNPRDETQIQWILPTGAPVDQEPLVTKTDLYVENERGVLFSVDPRTGSMRWARPIGRSKLLALSPRRIYVMTAAGDLGVVDRATGDILASPAATFDRMGLCVRGHDLPLTNRQNDRLYLASKTGMILSLREIGLAQPVNHREGLENFGDVEQAQLEEAERKRATPPPPQPGMLENPDANP